MCAIDWSLIGMKQFLYAIHQHSEKRTDIYCKVTFGFKYTNIFTILTVDKGWKMLKNKWVIPPPSLSVGLYFKTKSFESQ